MIHPPFGINAGKTHNHDDPHKYTHQYSFLPALFCPLTSKILSNACRFSLKKMNKISPGNFKMNLKENIPMNNNSQGYYY